MLRNTQLEFEIKKEKIYKLCLPSNPLICRDLDSKPPAVPVRPLNTFDLTFEKNFKNFLRVLFWTLF